MADISTVSARIAQVETEVADFAKQVRTKRDALVKELQDHVDSHKAVQERIESEVQAAMELMERISPVDKPKAGSDSPQFVLTKKHWFIQLCEHWRLVVLSICVLAIAWYWISQT